MSTSQANAANQSTPQSSKMETSFPEQKTPETAELLRPESNESGLSSVMRSQIQNMVKVQFENKFGREPSAEELESFSSAVMSQFFETSAAAVPKPEEETPEVDPDYKPEEDEDQGADEAEEEEEMAQLVNENEAAEEEKSEMVQDQDESNLKEEMSAALANVRLMAASQRQKILEAAKKQYEAETGQVADEETLSEAFNLLKGKLYPDGTRPEQDASEEVEDDSKQQPSAEEDDEEAAAIEAEMEDDESAEPEITLTEEELRAEIELAFEAVRQRGQMDGRRLAELVSGTFYEINGREADSSDIAAVFQRIKAKLAEEAAEELIYDDDEAIAEPVDQPTISEQVDAIVAQLPDSAGELESEKRAKLVEYARTVVTRQMAGKARQQFVSLTNREPSTEELEDLLITLATTAFVDADFEGSHASDSDYNPNAFSEKIILEKDAQIEQEECGSVDKADAYDVLGGYDSARVAVPPSVAFYSPIRNNKPQETYLAKAIARFEKTNKRAPNEEEQAKLAKFVSTSDLVVLDGAAQPPSPPRRKPVAFFSPMRTQQTKKIDFNTLDEKLMLRAVKHFENIHKRGPNEEESVQLGKFLTTDGLNYEWSDDENDSDYDPNNDESCDVAADNNLTQAFDAEFEKEEKEMERNDENTPAADNQQ